MPKLPKLTRGDKLARRQVPERQERNEELNSQLAVARQERDIARANEKELRRQLQSIKEAHEPLYQAIFPSLVGLWAGGIPFDFKTAFPPGKTLPTGKTYFPSVILNG